MNGLLRLTTAFAIPLGVLNAVGGVIAGIWLAILGEWGMIGWGFAFMVFSSWGLSFAMMPGMIFAFPIAYFFDRGQRVLAYPFVFLAGLYNTAVITVWCGWTLAFFAQRADGSSMIPALLWAYGAATGPLAYMTQKEGQGGGDNTGATITTYFAQLGFVIMVGAALVAGLSIAEAMVIFAAVMLIGTGFQFIVALQAQRERDAIVGRAA